jgi:Bacteriophage tail sheath protein
VPIAPTYPGVYIEEVPSGVRTIVGVGTSVAAFVGFTLRGPTNEGVQIFSFADYERQFGGLNKDSPLSYAVQQFFLNGGTEAWIVRVAAGAAAASVDLKNGVGGLDPVVLSVSAKSDGGWSNLLRLDVDYDTANPDSLFNLTVTELQDQGGTLTVARVEKHRNLSMSSFSPTFVEGVVNAGSELVKVKRTAPASSYENDNGTSTSGPLTAAELALLDDDHRRLAVTLDGNGPLEFDFMQAGDPAPASVAALATLIQTAAIAAFGPGTITVADSGGRLLATSQTPNGQGEKSSVRFSNASLRNAAGILKLGLSNGGHERDGTAGARPAPTGTVGASLAGLDLTTLAATGSMKVTLQHPTLPDDGPYTLDLWGASPLPPKPVSLEELSSRLQTALASSAKAPLNQAKGSLVAAQLQVRAGGTNPNLRLNFSTGVASTLGLDPGVDNVAAYALGSAGLSSQAQVAGLTGTDGTPPTPTLLKGSRALKTGIYALEDVDLFNILCLPDVSDVGLLSEAIVYAGERRAFVILDFPASVDTMVEAKQWLSTNATLRSKNAAIYFPRIHMADPLDQGRLRAFPTCGAVAGLYARTDSARGVWKAPAGTEASLRAVQKLDYLLTDAENGVLNPLGINAIRNFPVFGPVVWGGRTLEGADALASEWKYVPVRRFALFLEESLFRGTKWVVFEPNDEPLWAQIRLNIGAFMQNLFRQGAFQGQTPREAYFVKCDKETTTQTDINLGIVNILVGFAPLKPAEFVIIKIQQIAGQIPT